MCITNYLNDFLFVAWLKVECDSRLRTFLKLCKEVGCPIALDKTEWGTTILVFLGCLLDGETMCVAVAEEKRLRALSQLQILRQNRKVKVYQLQSLLGLLNFLCKAIVPGRVFSRRLYAKIPSQLYSMQQQKKLKPYHHISTDKEFRQDCGVWINFLAASASDKSLLARPFLDWDLQSTVHEIRFWSDSSANPELGFGAVLRTTGCLANGKMASSRK